MKYAPQREVKLNLLFLLRSFLVVWLFTMAYPSRIIVGYPKLIDSEQFDEENREAIKRSLRIFLHFQKAAHTFCRIASGRCNKREIFYAFIGIQRGGRGC